MIHDPFDDNLPIHPNVVRYSGATKVKLRKLSCQNKDVDKAKKSSEVKCCKYLLENLRDVHFHGLKISYLCNVSRVAWRDVKVRSATERRNNARTKDSLDGVAFNACASSEI
jgi:hypothetical protein